MKKAFLLVVLLCGCVTLWAQKLYFVFIQSEAQTPFYVKMGDKVLSSSSSGYLILSRLKDSTYKLQIGPSAADGELQFSVPVKQNDRGLLLKKFPEGWGLFDLQSTQVLMPVDKRAGYSAGVRARDDRFTSLLARAADDTSLFYQPIFIAAATPKKSEVAKSEKSVPDKKPTTTKDTLAVAVSTAVAEPLQQDTMTFVVEKTVVLVPNSDSTAKTSLREDVITTKTSELLPETEEAVYKRSKVTRRAESSNVDGFGLVFWDEIDGVTDTVRILIPNQRIVFADAEATSVPVQPVATPSISKVPEPAPANCSGQASEKEFFRIRTNLVAYVNEKQMVTAAKSAFKKKCFSIEQIKSLSSLFLTQEGKWLFLEAAYPHVADKEQFATLQSELFEDTYLARFKSLIGK